jgi:MFS family permease
MTMAERGEGPDTLASSPSIQLRPLSWFRLIAIGILGLALNFHWSAIGLIILPSQVLQMVGNEQKGVVLAAIVTPGAFVSLFANPLFGLLSDQTRGWLARWGKRRPYIVLGTLLNVAALIWMVVARDVLSLGIAFSLLQFASNAIQAPFHALLPDIVPAEQRGKASGVIGILGVLGNIGGAVVAGSFGLVDAHKPLAEYQQGLWVAYGIIIALLVLFMLITILTVRESSGRSMQMAELEQAAHSTKAFEDGEARKPGQQELVPGEDRMAGSEGHHSRWPTWLTRSLLVTVLGTLAAVALCWGVMWLWNQFHFANIVLSGDVQQVVLELVATAGLLRIFQFNFRRYPDFAWVLITRMLMMFGIYIIQTFLQYYLHDVVRVENAEQQASNFVIIVALTSLGSSLVAGWLSDTLGRKRLIYISGTLMAVVGTIFILVHDLPLVLAAGAIFGIGFGAYTTVDWALVADVLPSHRTYARDMGVWNVSLSLPQVVAPVIGGPLIDTFVQKGQPVLGFQILFALAIVFCLVGTVTVRNIRGVIK